MATIHIGTSGFYYSHWIGDFYPQNLPKNKLLSYYVKFFDTVEINSTFYHLPKEETVRNWKKNTPADFIFSFKISRFISHIKRLNPPKEAINIFFDRLKVFADSKIKHLILIQTPSNLKIDTIKLKNFLKLLPKNFLYAFEFRHQSLFVPEIYDLLKKYNSAVVLSDSPQKIDDSRIWPYENIDTADFFISAFTVPKASIVRHTQLKS